MEEYKESKRIVSIDEFIERVKLSPTSHDEAEKYLNQSFMPFKVTEHYVRLIERQEYQKVREQLISIVIPPKGEKPIEGRFDPYGNTESRQDKTPFLQHKYEKTLLVHIVDNCLANCQFCYKTREIREEQASRSSSVDEKLYAAIRYLNNHPEIDNVLLSGGDPATLSSSALIKIISKLSELDNVRVIRLATKSLAYFPQRFRDKTLLESFNRINSQEGKRINIITQYSHPAEIDAGSIESLRALQDSGVQIYGQPVILRGVNDNIETLVELQNKFLDNNIQSYYLVTFMPVKGVTQYALPLEKSFQLVAESKRRLNGLAKKGTLIAPHNWGKLEICGFLPSAESAEKIVLKWHEVAMQKYLPEIFKGVQAEDILLLDFNPDSIYCVDGLFKYNGLPSIE